ncbi:arginine/serine-rich protein PNISR-like isoform X2 [Cimex lectularius]|uniref:Arginine/serine-rich protein PNISR n=1 Tax=Cimex lectularius TaxID=79782 RepID=A0A8I6RB37_CIMLE|nr:arginine/serine-rich protein PNISR-like isoform X2 [Cimex lectularius]
MNPDFQNIWPANIAGQGDSFPPQWSMSSGTQYNMNVPQEQVDWASLAQQWIKMKEETPIEKEGGEAPMELTKDEPASNPVQQQQQQQPQQPWQPTPPPGNWTNTTWGWDQNSGWCWNTAKPPPAATFPNTYTPPVIPVEPVVPIPAQNVFCYTAPQVPVQQETYSSSSTYWSGSGAEPKESWENTTNSRKKEIVVADTPPELDAAKRKQLPAWIREGLEKMEREKQKKAENEKLEKLRQEELLKKTEISTPTNSSSNGEPQLPQKSKFESDSEESEQEVEQVQDPKKSRHTESLTKVVPLKPVFRTKEQILQACMVDVRKILTQILMEVTSEEIRKAVNETYKKFKKKAPAATIRKTPALSSLTGKLGLGIYESDSGSESEQEKVTDPDSDQDIRDRIERLKNEFVKVEVRIEREVAEQEERERKQLRGDVNNEGSINVEEQVQPINKGTVNHKEKYNNQSQKAKVVNEGKREKGNETREEPKDVKKVNDQRSHSYNSSESSSTDSRSPSPYYKKKHNKHHRKRYSRSSSRSRSRSKSRNRSRSRDRRHKKSHRHRSDSRKQSYRGRRRSSSSSSGEHRNRKSGRRR